MSKRKKILVLNGQYLPGYKGGGPIQSCINMIENLSDKFDFYVLTADRDFKSEKPYKNIKINEWNEVGSAKVFYMSQDKQTIKGFYNILKNIDFDIIYLNGFFSPIFTIKPLILKWLGKLKGKKIILTPRGDFTGGCENKKIKKYSYIYICKLIGLYNGLIWHATSELEEKDIRKKFKKANIFTIPNITAKYEPKNNIIEKIEGELRIIFISRIFPKKNLKFALEVLKEINEGDIIFDIYGPMENKDYWSECEKVIKETPSNVKVNYNGELEHSQIAKTFNKYHTFFFPTLGENYGHVIVEAMMNNCPVIIPTSVTPWDDYLLHLNIMASLNEKKDFIDIIKRLISMDQVQYNKYVDLNNNFAQKLLNNSDLVEKYKYKFDIL